MSKIDDKENSIENLGNSAEASAEASAISTTQANEFLNKTEAGLMAEPWDYP